MSLLSITIFDMRKLFIFTFIFAFGFWIGPWLGSFVFKKSLHAPLSTGLFWQERVVVEPTLTSKTVSFKYRFNSLGNPMRPFRGQKNTCLVIGGSTYFSKHVKWKDSFLNKLDQKNRMIYFEPYVYESLKDGQARTILQELNEKSKKYDCVIIGVQPTGKLESSDRMAFPFWGQYDKYRQRPFYWSYKKLKDSLFHSEHLGDFFHYFMPKKNSSMSRFESRMWRRDNPDKLIYLPLVLSQQLVDQRKRRMRLLFDEARRLATEVYFISQPIAYSEDEHSNVQDVWWDRYKRVTKDGNIVFLNNKAVAEEKRFFNKIAIDVAKTQDVEVIDLDHHLKGHLQYPRQMFYDKWHLTEYGVELAAEYVSNFLGKD